MGPLEGWGGALLIVGGVALIWLAILIYQDSRPIYRIVLVYGDGGSKVTESHLTSKRHAEAMAARINENFQRRGMPWVAYVERSHS